MPGDWNDEDRGPARNQTGPIVALRWLGAFGLALALIAAFVEAADGTATPGIWKWWVIGGVSSAIPLFVAARAFDYLAFIAASVHRLGRAAEKAAEKKEAA